MIHFQGKRAVAVALSASALVVLGACTSDPGGVTTPTTGVPTTTIYQPGPDCVPLNMIPSANFGIGCSMAGLSFDGVDISNAYAPETKLSGTTFENSNLDGTNFKYSNAPGLTVKHSSAIGFVLVGADSASIADATGSTWEDVDLTNAGLTFIDFSGSTFADVNLSGASLGGSVWTNTTLTNVTVSNDTICPDGAAYTAIDLCRGSLPGF